jgi:hypothetical protein
VVDLLGVKLATGKEGMGYGDLAARGPARGWRCSVVTDALLSSLIGAIGRHDRSVPTFGPSSAAAGWIQFVWGEHILALYRHVWPDVSAGGAEL